MLRVGLQARLLGRQFAAAIARGIELVAGRLESLLQFRESHADGLQLVL